MNENRGEGHKTFTELRTWVPQEVSTEVWNEMEEMEGMDSESESSLMLTYTTFDPDTILLIVTCLPFSPFLKQSIPKSQTQ